MRISAASISLSAVAASIIVSACYYRALTAALPDFPVHLLGIDSYVARALELSILFVPSLLLGVVFGSYLRPIRNQHESDEEYKKRTGCTSKNTHRVDVILLLFLIVLITKYLFIDPWHQIYFAVFLIVIVVVSLIPIAMSFFQIRIPSSGSQADRVLRVCSIAFASALALSYETGWKVGIEVRKECNLQSPCEVGLLLESTSNNIIFIRDGSILVEAKSSEFVVGEVAELTDRSVVCILGFEWFCRPRQLEGTSSEIE